jgi:hypothetical protein
VVVIEFDEMIERSQSLADWLSTEPDDIPGEDEHELYSALLTFEAIFGKLDWDEDGATLVEGQRGVFVCILLVIQEWLTERRPAPRCCHETQNCTRCRHEDYLENH